jgi:hypothetical protein
MKHKGVVLLNNLRKIIIGIFKKPHYLITTL